MFVQRLTLVILFLTSTPLFAAEPPKVVLIGDSIRMGYAPDVTKMFDGKVGIVSAKENGGDSANVLKHFDEWIVREKPDIVHLNCGLHDLKRPKGKDTYQVSLDQYESNLRKIVERVRSETKAKLIFATTTPIHDERHAKRGGFDRFESDVKKYNEVALKVMTEFKVTVNDLHAVIEKGGPEKLLLKDGTHYTPEGSRVLAEAVVAAIRQQLP